MPIPQGQTGHWCVRTARKLHTGERLERLCLSVQQPRTVELAPKEGEETTLPTGVRLGQPPAAAEKRRSIADD